MISVSSKFAFNGCGSYIEMEENKAKTLVRKNTVLKKLNAESLMAIERGLLGELPAKLKPLPAEPVRSQSNELVVSKPGFLASCLPLDSPNSSGRASSDDEVHTPLKKTFSFREKIRLSFFNKDKSRPKMENNIPDKYTQTDVKEQPKFMTQEEQEGKRKFWFFKNKDASAVQRRQKNENSLNTRSKSFEFLPKAIEENLLDDEVFSNNNRKLNKNTVSCIFGSSETMGDAWTSNDSLEFLSTFSNQPTKPARISSIPNLNIIEEDSVFGDTSSGSSFSNSSGIVIKLRRNSVPKKIEAFSDSSSDTEVYKSNKVPIIDSRKSSSYSTLQTNRSDKLSRLSEVRDDFVKELTETVTVKPIKMLKQRSGRRGSATDWFVLEENENEDKRQAVLNEKIKRASSTKYWITPEECAVYSRDQKPPLVIPRITQYRQPRYERPVNNTAHCYLEDSFHEPTQVKSSVRQYGRVHDWSPSSERRYEQERVMDSPPMVRLNKRLGGSSENLLITNIRRPNHICLPASSSGDSLDIEIRDRDQTAPRNRKSRSMVAPKPRMRSPVPMPRGQINQAVEAAVVYEGPIKRTKFSESGKKCKKHWTDCYMLLTQTALVFYKDQRTYHASRIPKQPGTPPSPTAPRAELVLPLRNAHIVHCIQMHTRRFTRSLVLTVGYDQYLLQDDSEDGVKRWLNRIQSIIFKLGPPTLDEYPTPQYQSSSTDLESLGRTPPVTRHPNRTKHKAGGSSNEDLSETDVSIQKSHVKSRLRKFFARRPTMEVLVKKGIYKDEPVFGRNLEEVCPMTSPRVPEFVVACVNEIERSEENICTDGLYRASGNLSQVQKIRLEIDQNNISVIENSPDIHVLAGSLKLFFRELKEPLIPCSMFDRVLAACSIKPKEARTREFREIVNSLPQCNRDTLKFLLEHLLRVTQHSEQNRMHTANLAIVFGPTLLWAPAAQAHNIAVDCIQQNNVVDILLTDFKEIFSEEKKKK